MMMHAQTYTLGSIRLVKSEVFNVFSFRSQPEEANTDKDEELQYLIPICLGGHTVFFMIPNPKPLYREEMRENKKQQHIVPL